MFINNYSDFILVPSIDVTFLITYSPTLISPGRDYGGRFMVYRAIDLTYMPGNGFRCTVFALPSPFSLRDTRSRISCFSSI